MGTLRVLFLLVTLLKHWLLSWASSCLCLSYGSSYQINGVCLTGWAFKHTWAWAMTSPHLGVMTAWIIFDALSDFFNRAHYKHMKFKGSVFLCMGGMCLWMILIWAFCNWAWTECKDREALRQWAGSHYGSLCDKALCRQEWNAWQGLRAVSVTLDHNGWQECVCTQQMFKLFQKNKLSDHMSLFQGTMTHG